MSASGRVAPLSGKFVIDFSERRREQLLLQVLLALVPIGLLLAIGRSLSALQLPGEPFWPLLDRLIYFLLLPVLLFKTILKTDVTVGSAPL